MAWDWRWASREKVVVLDGDGSLLMNLSALATIANLAPPNLVHFVLNNGAYEVNGNFPIPGEGKVNFAGLAREAGYAASFEFSELAEFEAAIEEILTCRAGLRGLKADLKTAPTEGLRHHSRAGNPADLS